MFFRHSQQTQSTQTEEPTDIHELLASRENYIKLLEKELGDKNTIIQDCNQTISELKVKIASTECGQNENDQLQEEKEQTTGNEDNIVKERENLDNINEFNFEVAPEYVLVKQVIKT